MRPGELSVCSQFVFPSPRKRVVSSQDLRHVVFFCERPTSPSDAHLAHLGLSDSLSRMPPAAYDSDLLLFECACRLCSHGALRWHLTLEDMPGLQGLLRPRLCTLQMSESWYWDSAKLLRSTMRLSSEPLGPHPISQASQKCLDRGVPARLPCL